MSCLVLVILMVLAVRGGCEDRSMRDGSTQPPNCSPREPRWPRRLVYWPSGTDARCARRAHAAAAGRVVVPEQTTVFTVKLPSTLVARVRAAARESGTTISAMVAQALTEYLASGKRKRQRP